MARPFHWSVMLAGPEVESRGVVRRSARSLLLLSSFSHHPLQTSSLHPSYPLSSSTSYLLTLSIFPISCFSTSHHFRARSVHHMVLPSIGLIPNPHASLLPFLSFPSCLLSQLLFNMSRFSILALISSSLDWLANRIYAMADPTRETQISGEATQRIASPPARQNAVGYV